MKEERYSDFKAPDFLLDDDFVAWLKGDNPAADTGWQQWLTENPAGHVEVEKARLLWQSMAFQHRPLGEGEVNEAWQKLQDRVGQESHSDGAEVKYVPARIIPVWRWLAAASILLIAGVWMGKDYLLKSQSPRLVQTQTVNGQQLTITLIDGTTVRLNAGSMLTYPQDFSAYKREVRLKGEAYFEVAPDVAAPFVIHTDDLDVQVIGTKFAVKAYPESALVKVAVVEGKVAVLANGQEASPEGEKVLLTKDKMAVMEKGNGALNVTDFDKNDVLGWQNGILYIEKADFAQVKSLLERWYGVEISVDDKVAMDAAWRFSGKFENQSIDHILDVCRYPDLFTYRVSGKQVNITKP